MATLGVDRPRQPEVFLKQGKVTNDIEGNC